MMLMDMTSVRTAVIGLIGFAATEEQMLLAVAAAEDVAEPSRPADWAAVPLVAHITEFKRQQVQRLEAIRAGQTPPAFEPIDHLSDEVYRRYREQAPAEVAAASRETSQDLIVALNATAAEDLAGGPTGRQRWLQVVVRGFWHPLGHLGDYYLAHGLARRAVALQHQAVSWAAYLDAPDPVRGMATYNLACALAQTDRPGEAVDAVAEAVMLNSALVSNVSRDPDLAPLRDSGRLDMVLAHQ
jgi:hypothetical protein